MYTRSSMPARASLLLAERHYQILRDLYTYECLPAGELH